MTSEEPSIRSSEEGQPVGTGGSERARRASSGDRARTRGKIRLVVFKVVVVLFSGLLLVGLFPALRGIVINWLPDEAFLSIRTDLEPAQVVHRLHSTALAVICWGLLIGVAVQLHRPRGKVAAMLMALAVPPGIALGEIVAGNYTVMGTAILFAALLLVAVLHPGARDLVKVRRADPTMAGLTLVAAAPWMVFAVQQAKSGRSAVEWDVAHHAFVSALAILIVLWGLIGASDRSGWRFPAWASGIAAAVLGLKSLVFPEVLSGLSPAWALAALAWSACYLIAAESRRRRRRHADGEIEESATL